MTYQIYHNSSFSYQNIVTFSHNLARLKPRDTQFQKLEGFELEITPDATNHDTFVDYFGNNVSHLLVREAHNMLSMSAKSRISVDAEKFAQHIKKSQTSLVRVADAIAHVHRFDGKDIAAKQYLFETPMTKGFEALRAYAQSSFEPQRNLFEAAQEFTQRVFEDFTFQSGFSDVATPVETVFEARMGVCQDFAHLSIAALRALGLSVRYVSGYIETDPPEGEEKLFGADASHAWFSLFIPNLGWVDFDPTNNLVVRERHIVLGWGRDYADIAPLQGVVRSSGMSRVDVMVDVRPCEGQ